MPGIRGEKGFCFYPGEHQGRAVLRQEQKGLKGQSVAGEQISVVELLLPLNPLRPSLCSLAGFSIIDVIRAAVAQTVQLC